jgi:RNA polymerase sigma-70 factor (ECF subfamily)
LSNADDSNESARRLGGLYREVGPQLLAWFHRRHRSAHTAEDLLHGTFAAVMKHPERLLLSATPRAYLFGVARNLSMEAYRQGGPVLELVAELPVEEAAPADGRLDDMRTAVAKLNPALREVLELRLQAELSYEEIGAVLGIPIGTVRSRLHHAVKQLRQALNRHADSRKAEQL